MSAVTTPTTTGSSTITAAAPTPVATTTPAATTPTLYCANLSQPTNGVCSDGSTPGTLYCDDLSTPSGTPLTCTDGTTPTIVTDLGQDTSGILPSDWEVESWAPALFARAHNEGMGCNSCVNNEYTIMPFSPAYFAHTPEFEVEEFGPAYYAAQPASANIAAWFKQHLCPHVSQDPSKGPVNCYNLWLVLALGISAVAIGIALK